MTEEELSGIERRSAQDIMERLSVSLGTFEIGIEVAMNTEWWRGYYAGKRETEDFALDVYSALSELLEEHENNPTGLTALRAANHAREVLSKARGEI